MKGTIFQINISKGGVPKLPVAVARLSTEGLEGDVQQDKKHHGGQERALCIFSLAIIQELQREGHPIEVGSTGENLTLDFSDFHLLVPGVQLQLGNEVIIQITDYAAPCKTIKDSFIDEDFTRISQKLFPAYARLYARVLNAGFLHKGDSVVLL